MPRRKKFKIPVKHVRTTLVVVFILFICFASGKGVYQYLTTAKLFRIKAVSKEKNLQFVKSKELDRLKGRNIFKANLKWVQNQLRAQYPQVSQLKILRRFPDEIIVVAKNRSLFAQVMLGQRYVTLDRDSVVLSSDSEMTEALPVIRGVSAGSVKVVMGAALRQRHLDSAIQILKAFDQQELLKGTIVNIVDVDNLSKIAVILDNGLKIIFDREKVENKTKMLALLLSQNKFDAQDINYIDLRFKEPIVGKK